MLIPDVLTQIAQNGPKIRLSMLKITPAAKKYTTAVLAVVTNISYGLVAVAR